MVTGKVLRRLRMEKIRLVKLAKKQDMVNRKRMAARTELKKLKSDISALKLRAGKDVVSKLRRAEGRIRSNATSPEQRRKLIVAKKNIKGAFSAFQRFANKHGEKIEL